MSEQSGQSLNAQNFIILFAMFHPEGSSSGNSYKTGDTMLVTCASFDQA